MAVGGVRSHGERGIEGREQGRKVFMFEQDEPTREDAVRIRAPCSIG